MESQNKHLQQVDPQNIGGQKVAYSLILRNRNPVVDPKKTMEIEGFLSGYGMPEKSKLCIQWSSPDVINQNRPGELVNSIRCQIDPDTGKMRPIIGEKGLETIKLDPVGLVASLNRAYFFDTQEKYMDWALPRVISEVATGPLNAPPLLLRLNIDKDAPAGDYEVTFVFTYGKEQELMQDYKSVPFHVTSRWEQNQAYVYIFAAIIAFITLVTTVFWYFTHW